MKAVSHSLPDAEILAKEFKDFTYIISHDFNAPLRGMVEVSKLLREEYVHKLDEEGMLYINLIQQGGEKMQAMLNGVLEYSRLTTAAKPHSDVNCNQIMELCRAEKKDMFESGKGVLESASLPVISGDAAQITRLFQILMDNAFKFHKPDTVPHVSVSAVEQAGMWLFTVRDNGIGIETEFHQAIFRMFRKLHNDTEYPGVGAGLTLAKKIVEQHGGEIGVESTPAKGSAFTFTLPQKD